MIIRTRKEICDTALTYLNTPFHHQGRLKNIGVDCAGLVIEVAKELDIYEAGDIEGYSRLPDGIQLLTTLRKNATEKRIDEAQPGDILLMRFNEQPQHLAFLLDNNKIIHSYMRARKVVMHELDVNWKSKVISVFKFNHVVEDESKIEE